MPLLIRYVRRIGGNARNSQSCSQHECECKTGSLHFLLYPVGQVGFTAVTVLVILPLMQVMVDFFATELAAGAGVAVAAGVGVTEALGDGVGAGASWVSFTLIVGDE
jgi:uncharacterized membrane protein